MVSPVPEVRVRRTPGDFPPVQYIRANRGSRAGPGTQVEKRGGKGVRKRARERGSQTAPFWLYMESSYHNLKYWIQLKATYPGYRAHAPSANMVANVV